MWFTIAIIVNCVIRIGQYLFDAAITFNTAINIQMGEKLGTVIGGDATW